MTDNAHALGAQNATLLEALAAGPAASRLELAASAGVVENNLNRKLASLTEAGLIEKVGEAAHEVALTEAGQRARQANALFNGELIAGELLTGDGSGAVDIPIELIDPWPDQPRTQFDEPFIDDLSVSIADKGVLQALTVRPVGDRFQVIIGENRRRASVLAVEKGWLAAGFPVPCKVRELSDDEAFEIAISENAQREDLHWMDEARSLLRLANMGRSAAQIERIFGNRGKRSIQDYTKIARELADDVLALAYLPPKLANGQPNPQCLTYTRARELVGEKKERPALELSARQALAFLEVLAAAGEQPSSAINRGLIQTRLHKAPTGGPLIDLSRDKKLIEFGFEGAVVLAKVKITEDVARFLDQRGFADNRPLCLLNARVAALGDLQAGALAPGEYATPELNAPPPAPAPIAPIEPDPLTPTQRRILREIAARSVHRHRLLDGWVLAQAAACIDPDYQVLWDLEFVTHRATSEAEVEIALTLRGRDHLKARDQAPQDGLSRNSCATPWLREILPEAEGTSPPPAEPKTLPPMLAIVVIEAAHKIALEGIERGPGTWAVEVQAAYYKDARGAQLVQDHKMVAFMPMGMKTLVALTKTARDWLADVQQVAFSDAGKPLMQPGDIVAYQQGMPVDGAGPYSTFWLNPPAEEAQAPALAAPPTPAAEPAPAPSPHRDQFSEDIIRVGKETRALAGAVFALEQARTMLSSATSRRLTGAELKQTFALIEAAINAAGPHLPALGQ